MAALIDDRPSFLDVKLVADYLNLNEKKESPRE
jgi:hypothetical protein